MPQGAFEVHGLGDDFLRDKPKFAQIGQAFLDFIQDSTLVIHNASFDMKFLNAELGRAGFNRIPMAQSLDTLAIARKKFPGAPATLDALCRRFGVDNSNRELHGALLDSEILAEVYLELIGGRQPDLVLSSSNLGGQGSGIEGQAWKPQARLTPLPSRITEEETAAHDAFVEALGDGALWKKP